MGLIGAALGLRRRRPSAVAGFVLTLLALVALSAPAAALAAGPRRIGRKPALPAGARSVGALAQSTQLDVVVTLAPRDPQALAAYATAVSTPGSSVYRQYLSVSEFAQRFGPAQAQIAAARASLRAQGLTPGRLAPNDLSFPVTASAGRLAASFKTGFERYRLRSGRIAYANTSAPQVSGSGASVIQGVIGLDNLAVPHPEGLSKPRKRARGAAAGAAALGAGVSLPSVSSSAAPSPCPAANTDQATYGGHTANQIASAYEFDGLYGDGDFGSGVTVALYELEPYTASDISTYQTCYGTSATVTNETVEGGASCDGDAYCGLEDVLDIEAVIGLAPDANIRVYEGPNTNSGAYDTYASIVSDDIAKVISTSWGLCESQEGASAAAAENSLFEEAATQGQSIFAAAGDNGAQDCTNADGDPTGAAAVDDPASQPYVTGVGGTSLSSIGPPPHETVWNNSIGAGGGGVSTLWSMPSYQNGFAISQSSVSCGSAGDSCREVPDVSSDADPDTGYVIYWTPQSGKKNPPEWPTDWGVVGGTSAGGPTWASLTALADASSACSSSTVGFANPDLYAAARTDYASDFNDITSGNNSYDGVTGYAAGTGYDMASGLGSPKGAALAQALCGAAGDSVQITSSPSNQSSTAGRAITPVSAAATSANNATPITYSAAGLPAGLSIDSSSGEISGTPTKPGTYDVTVQAVDNDGMVAVAPKFTWTVAAPVVSLSGVPSSEAGRVKHAETVLTVSATDSAGAAITYTATGLPPGIHINHRTGVISGTPTKATRTTVTITAADAYGGSASRRFTFVVAGLPRVSAGKLHVSGTAGALSLTLHSGRYAPRLKKLELSVPGGASLSGGVATVRNDVRSFTLGGRRQSIGASVSGGRLYVTLQSAASAVRLRLSGVELSLTHALASGLSHRTRSLKLTLLITDTGGTRSRVTVKLR